MTKSEALEVLTRYGIRTGSTITTHTDPGRGMTDYVSVFVSHKGQVIDVTGSVAAAIGATRDKYGRIRMGGYGYNKGFQVVYSLGRVLRPDFRCTGKRTCPSNDHVNERTPDYRKGRRHSDGGYSLRHNY